VLGRVILRRTKVEVNRKPGDIRAIIEDPHNLAVATYANEMGEMYFTLPLDHPQLGECEPFRTHWEVQKWNGSAWVRLHKYAYGLLTDLDFTQDEVIVYGMDYIGLLSLSLDTRTPEEKADGTYKNFNKSTRHGGTKYKNEKISYILKEQLDSAQDEEDSLTGFIHRGQVDTMDTEISIYVTFRQRLDFIKGLLDSYRQGTGIGSRLVALYDNGEDRWEWRIDADPGVERPELRFEYGGLVQGFRILTYENFATRAMGVGVVLDSTKPIYRMFPNEGAVDSYVTQYGNIQVANVWQDLSDRNDLKRRVRQLYAERSRIGKKVALGIRVHSLMPFEGYDLSDHVILDLDRYALDTQAFGSGWWTIWGTEWRLAPDGHDELTLVIRPREDTKPADPDILDSDPVTPQPALCFGYGPPIPGEECDCGDDGYVDVLTGKVYVCKDGEFTGTVGADKWDSEFKTFDDFERIIAPSAGDITVIGVAEDLGVNYVEGDTHITIDLPDGCDVVGRHVFIYLDSHDDSDIQEFMETAGFTKLLATVGSDWFYRRIDGTEGWTATGEQLNVVLLGITPQVAGFAILLEGVYDEYPDNPGPWYVGGLSVTADPAGVSSPAWAGAPGIVLTSLRTNGGVISAGPAGYTVIGDYSDIDINVRGDYKLMVAGAENPGAYTATGAEQTHTALIRGGGLVAPGIGMNLPEPPKWEARLWDATGLSADWHIEDGWLVLEGTEVGGNVDTVSQYGASYDPDGDLIEDAPAGPYDVPHIVRITFVITEGLGGLGTFGVGFEWQWASATHEGQAGAYSVGIALRPTVGWVLIVDGVDYPLADVAVLDTDTVYILEIDFFGGLKVRVATEEALDSTMHIYNSLIIAEGLDQSKLALHGFVTAGCKAWVEEIAILMPPASNETFEGIFINYGDGATTVFQGFPTAEGTVQWEVDGILTEPESVDEEDGTVTFDRPLAWLSRVQQSGTRR
jgi:hypothetical protein